MYVIYYSLDAQELLNGRDGLEEQLRESMVQISHVEEQKLVALKDVEAMRVNMYYCHICTYSTTVAYDIMYVCITCMYVCMYVVLPHMYIQYWYVQYYCSIYVCMYLLLPHTHVCTLLPHTYICTTVTYVRMYYCHICIHYQ